MFGHLLLNASLCKTYFQDERLADQRAFGFLSNKVRRIVEVVKTKVIGVW